MSGWNRLNFQHDKGMQTDRQIKIIVYSEHERINKMQIYPIHIFLSFQIHVQLDSGEALFHIHKQTYLQNIE